jgi:aspartate ammonia-lyase
MSHRAHTRTLVLSLVMALCVAAGQDAQARPASLARSPQRGAVREQPLKQQIRRAVGRTVRAMRRANRPRAEVRGAVQETILRQVKGYRTRREYKAMKAAGLNVRYKDVRSFVHRELDTFVGKMQRPAGWDSASAGKRFGLFFRALNSGFTKKRTFPGNWKVMDNNARYQVARCFAGNCSTTQAPAELNKWLKLTGVSAPATSKKHSRVDQMLLNRVGGSSATKKRYYGSETAKAAENFKITGQRVPADFIKSVAQIKAAAAITNMRTGRLDRKVGLAIVKAAREVIAGKHKNQFITDSIQGGAGTSVNMNVNEVIAARASELLTGRVGDKKVVHPIDHVNMAQSTNDVYPTAARLTAYRRLKGLLNSYALLVGELEGKAREYKDLPKAGRTHLQDAVPIMLGREFKAYAAVLKRDMRDVKVAMKGLSSINMGATAIGTSLNAEPAYVKNIAKNLARISRVPVRRARDLVDATQNVDAMTRAHGVLKVSATNLIKICNDLRMMNSGPRAGFGEIQLPAMQKGSSIMPGKINPVIAEVANQIGYQVQGNDVTVNLAAQNGQFELNQMEPVLVRNLLSSIKIMDRGVHTLATRAIRGLKANDKHCMAGARNMLGLATALTPHLGYDRSAALAKQALKSGQSLYDVVVHSGDMNASQASKILDPARMARGGVLK